MELLEDFNINIGFGYRTHVIFKSKFSLSNWYDDFFSFLSQQRAITPFSKKLKCIGMSIVELTLITFYILQLTYYSYIYFLIWCSNFVLWDYIILGPNSRAIESSLLTKDKIERQGIKVEKGTINVWWFQSSHKNFNLDSYFKNYTYSVP